MKVFLLSLMLVASSVTSSFALSQQEMSQLNDLLQKRDLEILGAPPSDAPYDRHYDTGRVLAPPPGCMNPREVKSLPDPITHRVFIRWHCDGTPPSHH